MGYIWYIAVGLIAAYGVFLLLKKIVDNGKVLTILRSILEWTAVGVAVGVVLHFVVGIANIVIISGAIGAVIGLLAGVRSARKEEDDDQAAVEEAAVATD